MWKIAGVELGGSFECAGMLWVIDWKPIFEAQHFCSQPILKNTTEGHLP